ncbi:MAG: hypothetical protein PHW93_04780 [Candidatus Methanomethylophilaceae archaeon]|nr:hypothetical protein [Candidatus Methanomethylophilaceae archaeon]
MSLSILFKDELNGFYRSKVMLTLWVGLPVMALLLYVLSPDLEGISISGFVAVMVGSIGGMLSSVMIVISILNDREKGTYDLFFVRPLKRSNMVIAKFMAVYLCVAIAAFLAILLGTVTDTVVNETDIITNLDMVAETALTALSMMAITCSAGVLIGVFSPSILVGILLVLYGGNQLSVVVLMPMLMEGSDLLFTVSVGTAISIVMLALASFFFQRRTA